MNSSSSVKSNESSGTRRRVYLGQKKSGLQFPIGRICRQLKESVDKKTRVRRDAGVFLAAVLEYLTAEVLEQAGMAARDNKKQRIHPRHIMLAVRNDEELNKLFGAATLPGSGVMPHIHPVLGPKKKIHGSRSNSLSSSSASFVTPSSSSSEDA